MRRIGLEKNCAKRGVYIAPWKGPNGEFVLLAITREQKLACPPRVIPIGGNHVQAGDEMWDLLESSDPIPDLRVI